MKKVFARLVNVIAVVGFLITGLGVYSLLSGGSKDVVWNGIGILVFTFVLNYIFLGKPTIWNDFGDLK
jgi:hypothetical protein